MKTKNLSILMFVASLMLNIQFANAQAWNLAGNTNMTNTSKIGGTSATVAQDFPLRLFTYNAERIHINANTSGKVGYVGIGTTAPNTRLHVNGVITATGGTSTAWNTAVSRVPAGTTSKVPRWNGTAYVAGAIFDNGTNVGIGTSSPDCKLNVSATPLTSISGTGSFQIGSTSSQNLVIDDDEIQSRSATGSPGLLALQRRGGSITLCEGGGEAYIYGELIASGANFNGRTNVDAGGHNAGGNLFYGLTFGFLPSEGISSNRAITGVNVKGLDFYTADINRLTITNSGNVGIGTTSPTTKLHVASSTTAGFFQSETGNAVSGNNEGPYTATVYGVSNAPDHDYALYGSIHTATGIAIYGYSPAGGLAGYFAGNVAYSGTLTGPSDIKLKKNISDLVGSLSKIMQLKPKSYNFRKDEFESLNLSEGLHYGVISQDLQKVFPELVKQESNHPTKDPATGKIGETVEYLGVNYIELIPIAIAAIQELDKQNEELKSQNNKLTEEVNQLKETVYGSSNMNNGSAKISLNETSNVPLLGQNIPNPAENNTIIPFRIPKNCNSASIVIAEAGSGKIVTAIPVSCNETHLAIDAGTLASGSYTYSLYIDGVVVDSKQMIVTK